MKLGKFGAAAVRTAAIAVFVLSAFGPSGTLAQTSTDVQSILNAISGQPTSSTTPTTGTTNQSVPSSPTVPTQATLPPVSPPAPPPIAQPPSQLEQLFSQRAGKPLTQFGYDVFGLGASVPVTQIGNLQDSYILGPGDQINIVLRGHEDTAYSVTVDRDGRLILPDLEPVAAGGRTFGEVREEILRRVAKVLIGTRAYISIGTVRQIAVLVTGEVASPGVRTLTGLNTPLDALLLSGGIKKTGSLRDVTIVRGSRRIRLDLYSVIANGAFSSVPALTEGDRIVVPPIGPTLAVTGLVKRPGIYELPPGSSGTSARSLISLAGGMEIAGAKRLAKMELQNTGKTLMVPVTNSSIVRAGEILFVDFERSASNGYITLAGEVTVPGTRALSSTPSMSHLIRDIDDLTPQSYTLFGVVVRHDPVSNFQSIVPFSLERTFARKEDLKFQDNDLIYVFNQSEIVALAAAASAALGSTSTSGNPLATLLPSSAPTTSQTAPAQAGQTSSASTTQPNNTSTQPAQTPQTSSSSTSASPAAPSTAAAPSPSPLFSGLSTALQAGNAPPAPPPAPTASLPTTGAPVVGLAQAQATVGATGGSAATVATTKSPQAQVSLDQIAANLGIPTVELVNSARDYLISVNGEVRNPGSYLAVPDTSLGSLIAAAGGVQREADLSAVEITSTIIDTSTGTSRTIRNSFRVTPRDFASISLKPFDTVRLRPVFSDRNGETVTIAGQVRYPGTFDITRGERLSSLLARAGGLTDEAYPFGTVFTRTSAAIQEADGNQRTARLLEDNIATVSTLPATLVNPGGLQYVENIAQALRTAPALGRISVTADPVILATKPELDILLQSGDAIYIPKRPSTVTVTGEVLNNGAFAYKPGLTVHDYISLAGGEGGAADDSLVFVVLPDGTARPEGDSWWSFGGGHEVPPGSLIVVPRDPQPFNTMLFMMNITDVVSKLAVTAASLAVISTKP